MLLIIISYRVLMAAILTDELATRRLHAKCEFLLWVPDHPLRLH
jgi:hypothetical protein